MSMLTFLLDYILFNGKYDKQFRSYITTKSWREKNDLGVHVVKQKRNFSQLFHLAPFPVHLNTPRTQ